MPEAGADPSTRRRPPPTNCKADSGVWCLQPRPRPQLGLHTQAAHHYPATCLIPTTLIISRRSSEASSSVSGTPIQTVYSDRGGVLRSGRRRGGVELNSGSNSQNVPDQHDIDYAPIALRSRALQPMASPRQSTTDDSGPAPVDDTISRTSSPEFTPDDVMRMFAPDIPRGLRAPDVSANTPEASHASGGNVSRRSAHLPAGPLPSTSRPAEYFGFHSSLGGVSGIGLDMPRAGRPDGDVNAASCPAQLTRAQDALRLEDTPTASQAYSSRGSNRRHRITRPSVVPPASPASTQGQHGWTNELKLDVRSMHPNAQLSLAGYNGRAKHYPSFELPAFSSAGIALPIP